MKKLSILLVTALVFLMSITNVFADMADKKYKDWEDVSKDMEVVLRDALKIYEAGGPDAGKEGYDKINEAYFKYYEKLGFEKIVMTTISGKRGSTVENQFYLARKSMRQNEDIDVVKDEVEVLIRYLHEDAKTLDGMRKTGSGWGVFFSVLGLTLREGLEAILVIAALIAYLVKTNNLKYVKGVYIGAILGIVASVILAIIFNIIAKQFGEDSSGASREIFEGCGMFLAVIVLFYVSNWMLSKSEVEVWNHYIQSKVESSITKGSAMALVFSSFLAVAREGAELIIFFQGMRDNISNNPAYMWGGLACAIVVLAIVYVLITKMSVKLPLKPFFTATSILMFVLCVSFIGKGVSELQEADLIGRTIIPWMNGFTIEILGIYDRVETLLAQVILIVITIVTLIVQIKRNKIKRAELERDYANKN
ncbi:FTR1 family protein [uncultured Fenollaria sp.]|uniref:FTR1 family iron permease n=1 Tax=uncultured Fenollaria sp. TaxID=1686315 RepID=UPI0025E0A4D9|nr:FTR1 family protein [uncultured Fenollaria sp.]